MKTLKLGRDTGSLMNHIFSGANSLIPEIGMGATILMWTDRIACTIVEVDNGGKRVGITEDKATRTDNNGMSESQEYSYESVPGPARRYFTLRKNGLWVQEREPITGTRLHIGDRNHYYDFSF